MATRAPPVSVSPPAERARMPSSGCSRSLIKKSFLIIIDCPAHFGKQLQRRALAAAAAAAKYRHVTLVFTPSDGPRSDMRVRKVGQQPSLPSGCWTSAHKHSERGPQMARNPFQGSSAARRRKTHTRKTNFRSLTRPFIH